MPIRGSGLGLRKNADGYLEIVRRGPLRFHKAHREYVNRQWRETHGEDMPRELEVHHLCRNRACWPPTDFHLVVIDARLHEAFEAGANPHKRRRAARGRA